MVRIMAVPCKHLQHFLKGGIVSYLGNNDDDVIWPQALFQTFQV